jgi:chemotaxis protein histidine kinase CheA
MSLRGRHARASVAPTVRFLIVSLGGVSFALHADRVQGLLTVDEAGFESVIRVQGVAYPKIDLASHLRLAPGSEGPETRFVLLAKGGQRGHLRADAVIGLREVEASEVRPLSRQFQGDEQRWYQGLILVEESVALILNPAWVLGGVESAPAGGSVGARSEPRLIGQPAAAGGMA